MFSSEKSGGLRLLGLVVVATSLAAQTAEITGRVADQSGAVIRDAKVTVTNLQTGVARVVLSNKDGYYTAALLTRGGYDIVAESTGFEQTRLSGLTLDEGQVLRQDLTMTVGAITQSVDVSAAGALLQTEEASLTRVVRNKDVVDLPNVGRNPLALAALDAGVRPTGLFGSTPVGAFDGARASIAGASPSATNHMVDGTAAENQTSGTLMIPLSVDATEEFRIISKNPSAEYGRTGGGVINIISKAGTNEFHGSAYEFLRNTVLNANDFFNNIVGAGKPPLVFNEFGATVGGPIRKSKTFFFFNAESYYQNNTGSATSTATTSGFFRTVPTDLQRQGNFSQTYANTGQLIVIYDPYTTAVDPSNPANRIRSPFAGNIIPANRISPVAQAVEQFYPEPNTAGSPFTAANNLHEVPPTPASQNIYGLRIDHYLSPLRRVFARYTWSQTPNDGGNFYGNIAEPGNSPNYYVRNSSVVNYTDAFTPQLLLEARAGFNRYSNNRQPRSLGFDITKIKLPGALESQEQLPLFPLFNTTDTYQIGSNQADQILQGNNAWTGAGAVTWVHGSHNVKMGAELRVYQLDNTQGGPNMQFDFNRSFTQGPNPNNSAITSGYGFATFLLGTPTSGTASHYAYTTITAKNFALFIQDDWKLSSKLTLNLGVRWEREGAATDRFNELTNFDPKLAYTINNVPFVGGNTFVAANGLGRGYRDNWDRQFGPRFGIAYQAAQSTVIRGAYGIYYLPTTGNTVSWPQAGFSRTTSMVTSVDGGFTPNDTLANPFPNGIPLALGAAAGPGASLGTAANGAVRAQSIPYAQEWNVNIQRQVFGQWLIEVGYAGNRGVHLPASRQYDYLPAQYLSLGAQLQQQVPNPYFGVITTGTLSAANVPRGALLDRFPQFNGAGYIDDWASSIYHALSLRVERRFSQGFSLVGSYVFSKIIDDNTGNGMNNFSNGGSDTVQNWDNLRSERAVSTLNMPHRLVLTGLWALPFGKSGSRLVRSVVGGWQLNGILTLQSGEPIAISQNAVAYGGNRPNVIGDPNSGFHQNINQWFNTAAFQVIPAFTYGNAPRDLPDTRTGRLFNLNCSALKDIPIRERARLQFRAEFFNATNSVTFGKPGTNISASNFGVVSAESTGTGPRVIQFGLKLLF
jgi:hypothetical protein